MFPGEWSNGSTGNSTLKSLNITLWFTIYSFHVETVTIHFLVPNSTKNHQKCIIWSIASTCKKNFQYKTIGGEILVPRYRKLQLLLLQAIVGVAVIAMFSGTFWRKNHLLIPLCCWDMAWKLGWKFLKVVPFLLQKLGRIFCPTLITKIVNISGSTQPFFTKQEPLDSQLDNKSFHYIIEMFSTTFRNSPESLLKVLLWWLGTRKFLN